MPIFTDSNLEHPIKIPQDVPSKDGIFIVLKFSDGPKQVFPIFFNFGKLASDKLIHQQNTATPNVSTEGKLIS